MKCPCEDCLKYPACKNKILVFCDDMINYARYMADSEPKGRSMGIVYWKTIRKYLTCESIYYEKYITEKDSILESILNNMENDNEVPM
jgi:hypothetical protein